MKKLLMLISIIFFFSCGESLTRNVFINRNFVYNPINKVEFVINNSFIGGGKNEYNDICVELTSICRDYLNSSYEGKKGYFVTGEPIRSHKYTSNPIFYLIILENGKEFYFQARANTDYFANTDDIVPYEDWIEKENFKSQNIEGTDIEIVSYDIIDYPDAYLIKPDEQYQRKLYLLDNGEYLTQENLNVYIKLSNILEKQNLNKSKLFNIISYLKVEYDKIDDLFFIEPEFSSKSYVKFYIRIRDKSITLRCKIRYYASDWLFINSFKILADDYRWESPTYNFKRDNAYGQIWEWIDIIPSEEFIKVSKEISNSKESLIRFNGSNYYNDVILTDDIKQGINSIVQLYELIK